MNFWKLYLMAAIYLNGAITLSRAVSLVKGHMDKGEVGCAVPEFYFLVWVSCELKWITDEEEANKGETIELV